MERREFAISEPSESDLQEMGPYYRRVYEREHLAKWAWEKLTAKGHVRAAVLEPDEIVISRADLRKAFEETHETQQEVEQHLFGGN